MSKHFNLDLIRQMNSLAVGAGSLAVWGLGQMGVAIKTAGQKMVYIDPVLSNVVAETFPDSAETFRRAFAAPVAAELVSNADVVLCTHEHLDHADPQTLRGIAQASPQAVFIAPLWAAAQLDEAGIPAERRIAPRVDQPLEVNGLRVWAVPAGHYDVDYDERRGYRYLSYVLEADGVVFFHSGDTIIYPGYLERLKEMPKADIGMVAANGRDVFREAAGIVGNLLPEEAVQMAQTLGWDVLLSGHNDLFEANTLPAGQMANALQRLNSRQKYHALQPGELYFYVC